MPSIHSINSNLLVFTLETQRYALDLASVERVVRVVEITPLPEAPGIVLGVINAHGTLIPVFNLRRRFRLPERGLRAAAAEFEYSAFRNQSARSAGSRSG